ncbi:acetyl-CoA synthetase-like protein, partial [Viridothelium virens]
MLGVIKSGCAAIALDPAQPDARLRSVVQQAQPGVIISSTANYERASLLADVPVFKLDETLLHLPEHSSRLPVVSPLDTAYISFTSGTTGLPKGACISHANVRSAVEYQGKKLGFCCESRVLDFAPYSFDVAWSNFLHTICAGGCICIASEQDMMNDLSSTIQVFNASLINVTPTVLRTISPIPSTLRTVLLSGEMPYRENLIWARHVRLLNTYGPTECTFKCAFSLLPSTKDERPDIGVGVGFGTWIVHPHDTDKLVSRGAVGELYLEGPLVGQGYLSNPEQTSTAFIHDPPWLLTGSSKFAGRRGRLYKTRDLVKYKTDGKLLFIGRKDASQLKIRGQRVEIGDVEYHARACLDDELPIIADVVHPAGNGSPSLVLFVNVKEHERERAKPLIDGLSQKLSKVLPSFMVPSFYLPVEEIPLAATGKVDRRRLREIGNGLSREDLNSLQSSIMTSAEYRKPSNEIEHHLRQLWARVLDLSPARISTTDSFFRLGGDSVAAVCLVAAAREKSLMLTAADIFRTPQLSDLANITRAQAKSQHDEAPAPFSLLNGKKEKLAVCQEAARLCGVEITEIEDVYPCTPLQQGMLAMTSRRAGDYISKVVFRLPHELDVGKFQKAWEATVKQISILRTRIIELSRNGLVNVVLSSPVTLHAHFPDGASLSQRGGMGLGTPLCRAGLLNGDRRLFYLEMHHAIHDGWCTMLILDTIAQAYRAEQTTFWPLVSFQSFIRYSMAIDVPKATEFWERQLSGLRATVFPSPSSNGGINMDFYHPISGLQWPSTNITASSIIRSATAMLLALYTNSDDVKFGTTISGRQASVTGIERMAGPTIATVPVRIKFGWDQTVEDLHEQIQSQALEMTDFEQFGLQRIQHITQDTQEASQFQLLLVVQPAVQGSSQQQGGLFSRRCTDSGDDLILEQTKSMGMFNSYAMMIICELEESGLKLRINFDSGAIQDIQVRRIAHQLELLLRQFCTEEGRNMKLCHVSALSEQDLVEISEWNRHIPRPTLNPVIDWIDTKSLAQPDVLAVSAWDMKITYYQLGRLSTSLAAKMRDKGVGTGSIIPLVFEKSAWMTVSILAILKAGATALPMSVSASIHRAHKVLHALGPKLVITSSIPESSAFYGFVPVFHISELVEPDRVDGTEKTRLAQPVSADPAIIIFTSGSTGTPKSISWSHASLSSNVHAAVSAFKITTGSRVFQFSAYDFDVSSLEALATLVAGGCLCVPSEDHRSDHLAEAIHEMQANWICLTPSVANTILPKDVPSLKTLVFTGEKLLQDPATRWTSTLHHLYNWYGPAEASCATVCTVEDETWKPGMIGRSIYGSSWLVDPKDHNFLAPIGTIAELCIEGPILANGYIGGDSQTSPENPFIFPRWLHHGRDVISGRNRPIYKTGDLVKYDSKGSIIFIGRSDDFQRKLRGQRVELSEIEHQVQCFLSKTTDTTIVAEIFRPQKSENEVLTLFVSPPAVLAGSAKELDHFMKRIFPVDDLERSLSDVLPPYMIPKLYIPILKIPTGYTGKIDRQRLRQIGSSLTLDQLAKIQPSRRELRKPSTYMEKVLQNLWAEIIGIERDTIHAGDNFLRLGGDSISAMRLVASAYAQGLSLTVAQVFQTPQLDKLAEVVKQDVNSPQQGVPPFTLLDLNIAHTEARLYAAEVCQVPHSHVIDMYPCTALQEGLLAMTVRRPGQYVSRSVLELQTGVDPERLEKAWRATTEKLTILRTRIIDYPGRGLFQVILVNVSWRTGDNVDAYLKEDEREEMGLGTDLCRAAIIDNRFILTIHHCIYDGSLLRMMLDELESKYLEQGGMNVTPFQNFIQYSTNVDPEAASKFWKQQIPNLEFRQFPVVPSPTYDPQANEDLSHGISLDWPSSGMTPSTIIRSTWAVLSAQYTDSGDVIFGATVSGRQADMKGIEDCVGPTISTVPVAVSIDWDETIRNFQKRIQHQSVSMMSYEHYGLSNIQRAIGDPGSGLFQTLLVVQPVAQGKSLQEDSLLFKARSFSSNIDTRGTDPFNTYALMLICELKTSGLQLHISFDNRLVQSGQIQRIAHQFETVLHQMCIADAESRKLGDICTASDIDLSFFWSENAEPYRAPQMCAHDQVASAARKTPESIAVDAWDGKFSYREVDELSDIFCQNLISLGVTRGSIIALCLEKSKWTPIAQLAVLKAGGVCLLQSVHMPERRMSSIFSSVGPHLAVASEMRSKIVTKYIRCFTISRLMERPIEDSIRTSLPEMSINDPAAILVSSGSTGEPKRILWTHRTLAANMNAHKEVAALSTSSRTFQFTSHDFDACTIETMSTLANSACLCIPSESERFDGVTAAINRFDCNLACLTPSTAKLLSPQEVPSLSTLFLGGENLVQEEVDRWRGRSRILNWYGPCECSAAAFCAADEEGWHNGMIGRSNSSPSTFCWLVNPKNHNKLVPFGAIGEIALEGPACAEKYQGNPELSNRSFCKDPDFLLCGRREGSPGRHGQIYRTGDLARYDSSGRLIFLGRKDALFKVRGQLVAPEEVEFHVRRLSRRANIDVVAELIVPKDGNNACLVAFISFAEAETASQDEFESLTAGMNEGLKASLPAFAIPSYYIPVASIPMTSTGKKDRIRLREIGASFQPQQQGTDGKREPATTAERTLRELWSCILRVDAEKISTSDSFLRLGDSIQAMRLVGAARQQGLSLKVADIFQFPKLKNMAKLLRNQDEVDEESSKSFLLLNPKVNVDQARQHAASLCNVEKDTIEDLYPCTPLQEGLLALTGMRKDDYVGHNMLKLASTVDVRRLKEAWEKVVSVIPILRTRIIDLPAQGLVQAVIRHISCWMEAESIEDYLSKQEELPMVLGSPLMRCGLFLDPESGPGGERSHVFALTLHHSIYDGLTTPIIFEVLERYYNGETPLRLFPFRSFIEYVSSQHWDAEGEFWKAQFDGLETTQFPALPSSSFKPKADSSYTHMVDGITWRTDDSTPSTVVRGAWAILCSRYTNLSDTVFGTIVSGRKAPTVGIERIAGPTISALPIRVNIDNGRNIVQFLQALQDQATKMISYEQTGLSKISRCSEEAKTACQFQTMLVVQPEQPDMMDSGLFVSEVGPSKRHKEEHRFHAFNTYALLAVCTVQAGQLKLELSFDSKVIGQATIQKLVQHFEQLLRNLCSRDLDTVCLRDVSMMTHQDLDQVWKWNARLPKSIEVCAHDMITNIAQAHPDAVAISAWDGELTYSQLDELSSAIAHRLIGYGVDRNMIVPLCFEKSLWMPVAFLSVMKAGGAGLFLDPTLPISRLEATLDQVEPRIILSSPSNKRLSSRLVANVLLLGAETDLLRSCNAAVTDKREDPLPNVGSADLLFAIFTSGSTGSPKGCLLQHRNFSSAVSHQRDVLQLDRSSRMYDFSSYAFDAAHWSALHVLCAGGTLCIPSEEERKNNLTDSIRRFRTTSIFLTPATARLIDPTRIPTLQSVYLGGEEVKTDDLAPWVSSANVAVVYGPTECSAMATYWSVPSTLPRQLSIGTGVGVLTWVIDPLSNTRLCPIGTIGELCLEGPLVGAGYLHDEEKTESAFLENPTWLMEGSPDGALPGRGGRVYRTGDLVKYNPADGTLLFLGRKDRQTKLRGQRVELSEVEHHVQQCLGRTHSVPTMIADIVVPKATEKDTLVVFIQHESQSTTQLDELVNHLQIALPERLPLSMVPSAYIPIEAVPLTASGKIDRRHLRQIGADLTIEQLAGATEAAAEVPVSTDAEHCLRQLWAVVLGLPIETIGANSGFLRLGGDSIAAMRLAALARSQSIDLTVQHILRSPRLSEMAKAITSRSRPSDTLVEEETVEPFSLLRMANMKDKSIAHISRLCGTQASDIEDAFPCTDVQKSLLSVTAKRPGDYIARLLLELRDDLDIDRLKQAWEDVSRSTAPILRSRIVDIPIEGLIQVQLGEQLEWQTSPSLQAYLEYDQRRPMGLSSRLTRLAIVEQSETGRRYCVLTQHHAIYDGHSLDLLLEEVSNSYMGEINKYPVAPFQAFLKHTVRTDKENAREFWRHQFSDSEA